LLPPVVNKTSVPHGYPWWRAVSSTAVIAQTGGRSFEVFGPPQSHAFPLALRRLVSRLGAAQNAMYFVVSDADADKTGDDPTRLFMNVSPS